MKPEAHGGDLLRMAATAGRDPASLLDFSVNVRPEGPPEFIRAALFRAMTSLAAYPSPYPRKVVSSAQQVIATRPGTKNLLPIPRGFMTGGIPG